MSEYGVVDVWSENKNIFELLRPDWQQYGTCRGEGTDIFFHERYSHAVREAKKLCDICVVREKCLDFAYKYEVVGVWGGTTTVERKRHIRLQRYLGLPDGKLKQRQRHARRIDGGEMVER